MQNTARQTRDNRTITVDFHDETTYFKLLDDRKAFVEFVLAFLLALGLQLKHKTTCGGGGCLTRHSHYVRVRLGGVTLWRIQCTTCKAVFTVLCQTGLPRLPDRFATFSSRGNRATRGGGQQGTTRLGRRSWSARRARVRVPTWCHASSIGRPYARCA